MPKFFLLLLVSAAISLSAACSAATPTPIPATAVPTAEPTVPPATITPTPEPTAPPPTAIPPTPTRPAHALSVQEALPLFAYEPNSPFDLRVASEQEKDGVILQDVSYAAQDPAFAAITGGRISAYVVKPKGTGTFAGILFLHMLGGPKGSRQEFVAEATALAKQGVVSILPVGLFPWLERHTGDPDKDQQSIIKQVIEERRALDLLLAQPNVDAKRIAVVGHDYGAMHAAVLAGVDKRVKAYVLMAGDPNYSDWAIRYFTPPQDPDLFRKVISAVDPDAYIGNAAPAALLFQFGTRDIFVSDENAKHFADAASEPKQVESYDAPHELDDAALRDRDEWLTKQLGLSKS